MPNGPTKYRTARDMSGLTQEKAAELLYTSVSNIKRIESGKQSCSADMAEAMAVVYEAPWVADPSTPIDYKPLPRAQAVLNYVNEREDVDALMPRARRILADGVVDESEKPDFNKVVKEIQEERQAALDLVYAVG